MTQETTMNKTETTTEETHPSPSEQCVVCGKAWHWISRTSWVYAPDPRAEEREFPCPDCLKDMVCP